MKKVVLVEIDPAVIELSKKYLPSLSNGAFDDHRLKLVLDDAAQYVKQTNQKFDVIICDSTDPEGPAAALFSSEFYGDCKKCLRRKGIFVNQNGVPFVQPEELTLTLENRKPHFRNIGFYVAPVPSYVGGLMAFGWASDCQYEVSRKKLTERLGRVNGKMKYYTPYLHKGAFALPQCMLDFLEQK